MFLCDYQVCTFSLSTSTTLYTNGLAIHSIDMHAYFGMSISLRGYVFQLKCPLKLPLWVLVEVSS
jgi:hypothetical protein